MRIKTKGYGIIHNKNLQLYSEGEPVDDILGSTLYLTPEDADGVLYTYDTRNEFSIVEVDITYDIKMYKEE